MDKILVTGGTGFVGQWMKRTAPPNLRVAYIGRKEYELRRWKFHAWDAIVHLANISPVEVLEHALKFDSRVLYASSGIIYHPENDGEYRQNKIAWEKDCIDSGVNVVIARLFTFSGEFLDDNKAIVQFERAAKTGQPLKIWGECVRSYMTGEDMGKRLWAVLLKGESKESYDIGSTIPETMTALAQRLIEKYKSNSEVVFENHAIPMPYYIPENVEKTERLLIE